MEKQKDKIKKQEYCIEKIKHNQARQVGSHSLPHSTQKIQADFLSKLLHFSRLPPLFYLKPPYPTQIPIQSYAQDTRLRVYTRSRSQRICHFCLHPSPYPTTNCISTGWGWRQTLHSPSPSPQQPEKQHVGPHRLQKTGEGKRVKPSPVTHTLSTPYSQKVKRWRQKHKITGRARVRTRIAYIHIELSGRGLYRKLGCAATVKWYEANKRDCVLLKSKCNKSFVFSEALIHEKHRGLASRWRSGCIRQRER